MNFTYETIAEENGFRLLRRSDDKWTVVRFDLEKFQVYSAMPKDMPKDGGRWFARDTFEGIAYVSSGYSENYARRIFKRMTK